MISDAFQPQAASYPTDDDRWAAVVRRDTRADGHFYYSVRTTGVFCRPSCAARLPRRENVSFHASIADALAAGFRACKRCRPDEASLQSRRAAQVATACRMLETADDPPDLGTLAAAVGLSRHHFHRTFKAMTGLTPRAYAAGHRAARLRAVLPETATVTDAIYAAGFNGSGRFYENVAGELGMTPTRLRSGGAGISIRFAVGDCSLGAILVAATGKGICAILLGDDAESLIHDLEDRFPKAHLLGGDVGFETWVARVVGLVESPRIGLDLPLDVQGTAFQRRVWKALRRIPVGATASYADVARAIGSPRAVRAVAQACGANALAVAIPCHRVVRSDGALSGYRWGVARKRALLDREAAD